MQAQLVKRRLPPVESGSCVLHLDHAAVHDLSGPVGRIGSLTELIIKKCQGRLDEETEVLFDHLQNSIGQLRKLMSGLGTYVRIIGSAGDYRCCRAGDLLAAALFSIQDSIRESEAVVTSSLLPDVRCDPNQIIYLLASLVDNSIKFRRNLAPRIHVSAAPAGDEWVISVQDDGIGIDPVHADRVFSTFRRIHGETYAGAGVGLAIAQEIVSRHGGRIWFESEPGSGSRFFFSLPKAR